MDEVTSSKCPARNASTIVPDTPDGRRIARTMMFVSRTARRGSGTAGRLTRLTDAFIGGGVQGVGVVGLQALLDVAQDAPVGARSGANERSRQQVRPLDGGQCIDLRQQIIHSACWPGHAAILADPHEIPHWCVADVGEPFAIPLPRHRGIRASEAALAGTRRSD
jgi:hypothetical protein